MGRGLGLAAAGLAIISSVRSAWPLLAACFTGAPGRPVVLLSAVAGLAAIAALASYLPARRAARVDAERPAPE
jgi:hypothetical protein